MADDSTSGPGFTLEDVQRQIDDAIRQTEERLREEHTREMETLRSTWAGGQPETSVPEHAGGPGLTMAQTWSLAEQEASRAAANAKAAAGT
jgi:hypothetical protein